MGRFKDEVQKNQTSKNELMQTILLKNASIINEGAHFTGSVLIKDELIEKIYISDPSEKDCNNADIVIDCSDLWLFPGIIDDQVHFREPGNTHKGNIESESIAAVLGGVTSFMDMPNNNPPSTTLEILEKKYQIAAESSFANYSFYLGATNSNIEELIKADNKNICGVKVFMGSSTGNMLVDDETALIDIFSKVGMLIATHCEDENIIRKNLETARAKYGENIPFSMHSSIRSREACIKSTEKALSLATKYNSRLHILHLSTAEEIELINRAKEINDKISCETCVHYLTFNNQDYKEYGSKIKCNPSIKGESDRVSIIDAVERGVIDVVATDHAPHTLEEKKSSYLNSPSGLPLVQHSLQVMIELHKEGNFPIAVIPERMCHAPARIFSIEKRGFIREGYFADIVIVDPNKEDNITTKRPAYRCGWSPFEGKSFASSIVHTFVNGAHVVKDGKITGIKNSKRLNFKYE